MYGLDVKFLGIRRRDEMKTLCRSIVYLFVLLLATPMQAQDLSKYRTFSIGTRLAVVLKHTDQALKDVTITHDHPSLLQEVKWWPNRSATPLRSDPVEQILFSFYNGELYKMSVTYDQSATEGLTAPDMMKLITAKYGRVTNVALEIDTHGNERYDSRAKSIACWEDAQYSVDLVRFTFTDGFGLVIYSKSLNADADLAIAQAVKLEEQEGPRREAARQKKATDDLEVARQKNIRVFQP
jgi:hypothetical protein